MLIQVGTNLHNDVADYRKGTDGDDRLGPPRATARGWLSAEMVERGAWLAFVLAWPSSWLSSWASAWRYSAVGPS